METNGATELFERKFDAVVRSIDCACVFYSDSTILRRVIMIGRLSRKCRGYIWPGLWPIYVARSAICRLLTSLTRHILRGRSKLFWNEYFVCGFVCLRLSLSFWKYVCYWWFCLISSVLTVCVSSRDVRLSVCQSVCLSVLMRVFMSLCCLFVYPSASVSLLVCLPVCPQAALISRIDGHD